MVDAVRTVPQSSRNSARGGGGTGGARQLRRRSSCVRSSYGSGPTALYVAPSVGLWGVGCGLITLTIQHYAV